MSKAAKQAVKAENPAQLDAWDTGALGQDEGFVERVDVSFDSSLDSALDLQPISIRLQKGLIEDLKLISLAHGIGYQPMIRDVLVKFAECEIKQIVNDTIKRRKQEAQKHQELKKASTRQTEKLAA